MSPKKDPKANYVLQVFNRKERKVLSKVIFKDFSENSEFTNHDMAMKFQRAFWRLIKYKLKVDDIAVNVYSTDSSKGKGLLNGESKAPVIINNDSEKLIALESKIKKLEEENAKLKSKHPKLKQKQAV